MADKKETGRDELHRAIWAIADELRGAIDGWDFKNYVLGTMFYRYISEHLCSYINSKEAEAGNSDFDYAAMSDETVKEGISDADREDLVKEKGVFILPSELFCNVRAGAAKDENLNTTLECVFRNIESSAKGTDSEDSFAGLFDDFDVNSNKLGSTVAKRNERLVKLLDGVATMNLGDVKGHSIDAFGDAYEYLMNMYASAAGKSGGEFFTPADVSELLTRLGTVGKKEINKVYGINNINRFLQESNTNPAYAWDVQQYKVGDPVLFLENNWFHPVIYNNMRGKIVRIEKLDIGTSGERIQFDIELNTTIEGEDCSCLPLEFIENLENDHSIVRFCVYKTESSDEDDDGTTAGTIVPFQIAYAVSIHKAQGLEYDSVKIVITDEVDELITHNIFYTAITRTRKDLKIYWTPEVEKKVLGRIKPLNIDANVEILKHYISSHALYS